MTLFNKTNIGLRALDMRYVLPKSLQGPSYGTKNNAWAVIAYSGVLRKAHKEELLKVALELSDRHGVQRKDVEQNVRWAIFGETRDYLKTVPILHKRTGARMTLTEYLADSTNAPYWNMYFTGRGGSDISILVPKIRFNFKEVS